jgi:hypothetical protein
MWLRPGCFTHSNACLKGVASEPGCDDGAAGLEPGQGEAGDPGGAAAPLDGAGILPADRCLAGAGPCCVGRRCAIAAYCAEHDMPPDNCQAWPD